MDRRIAIFALAALTIGLLAAGVSVASAERVYTIDDETDLDKPSTITEYSENGTATVAVDQLNMTITVTDDRREAGIDARTAGVMSTYIHVEYYEDVDRTIRFYVPAEYLQPRRNEGVQSETSNNEAVLEPVAGGEYTAVTIQVRGQTNAAFETNDAFGGYLAATDTVYTQLEDATGYEMPRLGARGQEQWQYPPEDALIGDNATYHIPTDPEHDDPMDMTIQYDNTPEKEEASWHAVKDCEQTVEPVCVTERNDEPVLFSTSDSNVPPIRYKHGTDHVSEAKSGWEELRDSWSDLIDGVLGSVGVPA